MHLFRAINGLPHYPQCGYRWGEGGDLTIAVFKSRTPSLGAGALFLIPPIPMIPCGAKGTPAFFYVNIR